MKINDRFVGMVGYGLFVPQLSSAIDCLNAVATDDLGVIVLAKAPALMLQTMPGATINTLTAEARIKRYKHAAFAPADISPISVVEGPHTLYRWRKEFRPYTMESHSTKHGTLRVHVLREMGKPFSNIRSDQVAWFGLVSILALVTAALRGLAAKYMISTQTQQDALLHLNKELAREANTDVLTGCANRRAFMQQLKQERDRSSRYNFDRCVLSLDIDHFKRINDTHGHAAGDEVLKHFVDIIQSNLRRVNRLGRVGREESSILMPQTSAEGGALMAERIRAAVESSPIVVDAVPIAVTVSIDGVLWPPGSAESFNGMLTQADSPLYKAKNAGRNRVEWAALPERSGSPSSPPSAQPQPA